MRVTAFLVVALFALGSAQKLSGQETSVLLDLTKQTAYLLENGRVALVSPIASGKEGRGTPTGHFQVIDKDATHTSADFGLIVDAYGRIVDPNATPSTRVPAGCHYEPAPMPDYMQLGPYFGMHGGYLPGYPASHGCVRMPHDLAAEFFSRVHVGTPVQIIGDSRNVTHVRKAIPMIQPGDAGYTVPLVKSTIKSQGGLQTNQPQMNTDIRR
ncbi:MAG: L,D-transpeptidase [Chthoniobacterales bacterium]